MGSIIIKMREIKGVVSLMLKSITAKESTNILIVFIVSCILSFISFAESIKYGGSMISFDTPTTTKNFFLNTITINSKDFIIFTISTSLFLILTYFISETINLLENITNINLSMRFYEILAIQKHNGQHKQNHANIAKLAKSISEFVFLTPSIIRTMFYEMPIIALTVTIITNELLLENTQIEDGSNSAILFYQLGFIVTSGILIFLARCLNRIGKRISLSKSIPIDSIFSHIGQDLKLIIEKIDTTKSQKDIEPQIKNITEKLGTMRSLWNKKSLLILFLSAANYISFLLVLIFFTMFASTAESINFGNCNIPVFTLSILVFHVKIPVLINFFRNINQIIDSANTIEKVFASLDKQEVKGDIDEKNFEIYKRKNIALQKIYYKPEACSKFIIKNLELSIKENEKVAIITNDENEMKILEKIISGKISPTAGNCFSYEQNNESNKSLDLHQLSFNVSAISDNVPMTQQSIKDNILCGKNISDSSLCELIKFAGLEKFINSLKDNESTINDKNLEHKLTSNIKKRIALARAILQDSQILVFNKLSMGVNTDDEGFITTAIFHLMKQKTCIIITNDPTEITFVNKIYVLKSGQIIEAGNHLQLIHNGGLYSNMYSKSISNVSPQNIN